jgi:hypothetical protein
MRRTRIPRPSLSLSLLVLLGVAALAPSGARAQIYSRGNQLLEAVGPLYHAGNVYEKGDFNGDGIADLVAGIVSANVDGVDGAGVIKVWTGSANGLVGGVEFHQDLGGVPGFPEEDDGFGTTMTAADFNGDGFEDLAIGVPHEDIAHGVTPAPDGGVVEILYGSNAGLSGTGAQLWSQESAGVAGDAEDGDVFGSDLAAGDFNGDGFADLAIGASYEDLGSQASAGVVAVLFGSASGLTATGSLLLDEGDLGGTVGGNGLGYALVAANFDDDDYVDLAIGAPLSTVTAHENAGVVWVVSGAATGLSLPGTRLFQGAVLPSGTIAGSSDEGDYFGSHLAAGDFNRVNATSPRYADLVIGIPNENGLSGAVQVINGSAGGLTAAGNYRFDEGDLPGAAASPFAFGSVLAAGPVYLAYRSDLVLGDPWMDVDGHAVAGRVFVVRGTSVGLDLAAARRFDGSTPGLAAGPAETNGAFGSGLAIGNFNGLGVRDLAVGARGLGPDDETDGLPQGRTQILYSALFAADFATQDLEQWSAHVP